MGLFDGGDLSGLFGGTSGLQDIASQSFNVGNLDLSGLTGGGTGSLGLNTSFDMTGLGQPAPSSGFDWGGALKTGLGAIGPLAQLGLTGMGIAGGIQGMKQGAQQNDILRAAQKQQQQTAQPAADAGSQLTAAGTSAMLGGPLPPELESQVQQKIAEMRAQLRSYFAHAGIGDSSMMAEYEGWINMQEQALRSTLAQNLLQSGYGGIGTALGATSALERSAGSQTQNTNALLAGANQAISLLTGAQGPQKKLEEQSA
jgi:hypothetical protein